MAGKLVRRGRINAIAPGHLVHIVDESTQRRFLVDTGAAYSIFPFSSHRQAVQIKIGDFGLATKVDPES